MTFARFYQQCQSLSPKVKRAQILSMVKEITGITNIKFMHAALDTRIIRGMIISPTNPNSPLVEQLGMSHVLRQNEGAHVIIIARELSDEWKRFVCVKEMMHLFDADEEFIDNAKDFGILVNDIIGGYTSDSDVGNSAALHSETACFVRAMAALCPEPARLELEQRRRDGLIDDAGIAMLLEIPEAIVPTYFSPNYRPAIAALIGIRAVAS